MIVCLILKSLENGIFLTPESRSGGPAKRKEEKIQRKSHKDFKVSDCIFEMNNFHNKPDSFENIVYEEL